MTSARILLAVCATITSVSAAERSLEIAPFVGYRSGATVDATSSSEAAGAEADPSMSWGLSVGWWVRPDSWLEVLFDRQTLAFTPNTGSEAGPFDMSVDYLQLGGGYEPPREGVRPYVTVAFGLGGYGSDPGSVSRSTGLSGSIGGGFKVPLGRKALLRFEARGWGMLTSSSAAVVCGPGCSFALGGSGWWQLGVRAAVAFRPGSTR